MNAVQRTLGAAAALLAMGMVGCDQSKAELDQTKMQLQTVSTERDSLKNQVNTLQGQVTTLTQQLSDANAKLAAAAAGPQSGAEASRPTSHRRSSPGTPSEQPPTQQEVERKAAEKQMTGKSSMNN
jgi:phage shock protein A